MIEKRRGEHPYLFLILLSLYFVGVCAVGISLADGPPTPASQPNPFQFILGTVNFFLMGFFVYYILMLRPQQLKQDEHARFLKDLKKDEEVVTTGGLVGRVAVVTADLITVDAGSGTKLKFKPDHVFPLKKKEESTEGRNAAKSSTKESSAK